MIAIPAVRHSDTIPVKQSRSNRALRNFYIIDLADLANKIAGYGSDSGILCLEMLIVNSYMERIMSTFSSWFHAWSHVHGIAKQTVSWHCVSHHSCICSKRSQIIHCAQSVFYILPWLHYWNSPSSTYIHLRLASSH